MRNKSLHKKIVTVLLFNLLSISGILGQEEKYDFSYESAPLREILFQWEEESGYTFYYVGSWLAGIEITAQINSASLSEALEQLLRATPLNYFLLPEEKRVIIIQRAQIFDRLPEGFLQEEPSDTLVDETAIRGNREPIPVFLPDLLTAQEGDYRLVKIGKQNPSSSARLYRLQGMARTSEGNEPIPDLPIRTSAGRVLGITDATGRFAIDLPPGLTRVEIGALGIRKIVRDLVMYDDGELNLVMEEDIQQLDEVVVEADAKANVESATTGTEQIRSEESKNIPVVFGERDILQVARNLPGISSAGEGATGFNVRGGKTDQNLVLLDGAVIYNPTHFFGIFQALNPFTTEEVTIYKGVLPTEYGGRLSSLFNIKSKDPGVEATAGEGSIGPVTANLAIELPVKRDSAGLMVGGRGAYADWILNSLDDESLSNSNASFYDVIAKYQQKMKSGDVIAATAYFSHDNFSITSDSLYRYTNGLFAFKWDHQISPTTNSTLQLGNSYYGFGIDYEADTNTNFRLKYGINQAQLNYHFSKTVEHHKLTYGAAADFFMVNPGRLDPFGAASSVAPVNVGREQALGLAVFAGDDYEISEALRIDLGLRFTLFSALGKSVQNSYVEGQPKTAATVAETRNYKDGELIKTYIGPEIRASMRYFLGNDLSVKMGFNTAYQYLHTLSNNTTVSPIDTWKLSDLNIKPQKGYQVSMGIFRNFPETAMEFSAEGFYRRMNDVLDFKTGATLFLNQNVETEVLQGDGKSYGIEFLLRKNSGDLNGWLSYTYSRSLYRFDSAFIEERINDGEYFPSNFDKPHDLSVILNYRFTRRYSVSANFAYQTGRPVTYPTGTFRFNNADFVVYSDRNAFRIPDYYRLDLGVNIEGNHRKNKLAHSFWTISVYNVLGRNNPYSVFFVTENGEVKALQSTIFSIPVPSITYNFKF